MNLEQIYGPLRAFAPLLTGILVQLGIGSEEAALAAGGLVAIIAAGWSYASNRPSAVAQQTVSSAPQAVQVLVGPDAPVDLKNAARDPTVPGIVLSDNVRSERGR